MEGNSNGKEGENERGNREGGKGEKGERRGVVPHPKQKSGCTTAHMVVWAIPHQLTITTITRGFEAEVCTGWMLFLSPKQ